MPCHLQLSESVDKGTKKIQSVIDYRLLHYCAKKSNGIIANDKYKIEMNV